MICNQVLQNHVTSQLTISYKNYHYNNVNSTRMVDMYIPDQDK